MTVSLPKSQGMRGKGKTSYISYSKAGFDLSYSLGTRGTIALIVVVSYWGFRGNAETSVKPSPRVLNLQVVNKCWEELESERGRLLWSETAWSQAAWAGRGCYGLVQCHEFCQSKKLGAEASNTAEGGRPRPGAGGLSLPMPAAQEGPLSLPCLCWSGRGLVKTAGTHSQERAEMMSLDVNLIVHTFS